MKRKTIEEFKNEINKIHGNDVIIPDDAVYINNSTKIKLICPKHGDYWQTPNKCLSGQHCPKCAKEINSKSKSLTTEKFIDKSKEIYGDNLIYDKVIYKNAYEKICLICPKHGDFWQRPHDNLNGCGCPKCGLESRKNKRKMDLDEFIHKAKAIHGDKYDYSKVNYANNRTNIEITCHKHGVFYQTPSNHLMGNGCPICRLSSLEESLDVLFDSNGIKYIKQYKNKWLGLQSLDFYLPEYNIGIECQGEQHFKPVKIFGGEEGFQKTQERDKRKAKKCKINDVTLLYFAKDNYGNNNVITDKNKLIEEIRKGKTHDNRPE